MNTGKIFIPGFSDRFTVNANLYICKLTQLSSYILRVLANLLRLIGFKSTFSDSDKSFSDLATYLEKLSVAFKQLSKIVKIPFASSTSTASNEIFFLVVKHVRNLQKNQMWL